MKLKDWSWNAEVKVLKWTYWKYWNYNIEVKVLKIMHSTPWNSKVDLKLWSYVGIKQTKNEVLSSTYWNWCVENIEMKVFKVLMWKYYKSHIEIKVLESKCWSSSIVIQILKWKNVHRAENRQPDVRSKNSFSLMSFLNFLYVQNLDSFHNISKVDTWIICPLSIMIFHDTLAVFSLTYHYYNKWKHRSA